MTQERMKDDDAAKVDANVKADASDASDASNIDTLKIDVKRGTGKQYTVEISLSRRVSLRQKALCDAQSCSDNADTWNFNTKSEAKKKRQS